MGQTSDDIRGDLERARAHLGANLNELQYRIKSELDWRVQFRRHTWAFLSAQPLASPCSSVWRSAEVLDGRHQLTGEPQDTPARLLQRVLRVVERDPLLVLGHAGLLNLTKCDAAFPHLGQIYR